MKRNSKETIAEVAISLFTTNGYTGTSLRDIAKKANMNIANISYHFQNKHGLLEYCFTTFFEQYLKKIEEGFELIDNGASYCLKEISKRMVNFLCDNILLSGFVFREMSIDSQIVREVMSTYCRKETYYLQKVLEKGIESKEFQVHSISYIIVQLKGLWMMPFLNSPYLREVLNLFPHERFFARKYNQEISYWIDQVLCVKPSASIELPI